MNDEPRSRWTGPGRSPGFLLWRVTLAWQRAMRAALAPHDLTHVQFVLLASAWWLGDHEEPPTQQRLAEQAGADTMMTSQVVRKLADRGLVNRSPDPHDARALRIVVTPEGREVLAAALRDVEQADTEYFAAVDDGFVDGLSRLLR
ncbi:MarR family winged helix-turn-helix transcriptional regulator [Kutzneria kofuensis]|uniref:DNA-binding MarR family transcriptional regulator n=1 Tax=Kutzneria kofuensis TaxID=103725 RepID=A0A7W9KGK0_9PSEU|nr:MarR family transcriptional regulator [Kutzneria kofuensis]MBB5891798.1 DNA-binding MarR family transcriptional regulator [Kutzneria kofuensis]